MGRLSLAIAFGIIWAGPTYSESLESAVRSAVSNNPAQQAARVETQASALELLELQREYLPTVSLSASAGGQKVENPASLSAADNGTLKLASQIGLSAELVLFDGQRRANLVYGNAARLDGTIFRLVDASEAMALNAVEAYVDVVRHAQLLQVAQSNVNRHQVVARQVRDLVEGGGLPSSAGLQVQDRVLAARIALTDVEAALQNAKDRYLAVIGNAPSGQMRLPAPSGLPRSKNDLIHSAIANSAEIRFASTRVQQRISDQGVAQSGNKPRVSLNADLSAGNNLNGSSGQQTDAFLGLRLNWTLFEGGTEQRDAALNARIREAELEMQSSELEVRELASRAWTNLKTAQQTLNLLSRQERSNISLVRQYNDEFDAAQRTLLDVLEAERALFNIRFQRVSGEAAVVFAKYRLLAVQSRLASHFGAASSNVSLIPNYAQRAESNARAVVFDTGIPALE